MEHWYESNVAPWSPFLFSSSSFNVLRWNRQKNFITFHKPFMMIHEPNKEQHCTNVQKSTSPITIRRISARPHEDFWTCTEGLSIWRAIASTELCPTRTCFLQHASRKLRGFVSLEELSKTSLVWLVVWPWFTWISRWFVLVQSAIRKSWRRDLANESRCKRPSKGGCTFQFLAEKKRLFMLTAWCHRSMIYLRPKGWTKGKLRFIMFIWAWKHDGIVICWIQIA